MTLTNYKQKYSVEHRIQESSRVLEKYPDRLPIIIQQEKDSNMPPLDKNKFLVPEDLTVGQMIYILRRRIKLSSEIAMYMFFNGTLAPTGKTIGSIYEKHKDPDGFLYVVVGAEKTFG